MNSSVSSRRWRWSALVMVIINALHGYWLSSLHPSLPSIAAISERNQSFLTPDNYAFAIWGLIYAGFASFCVYTLLPSQRNQPAFDSLARGLVAYALLGMAWTETFIRAHLGASVVIIGAMFVVGALMFGLAKRSLWAGVARAPLYAPFSLFFGWISVAALVNLTSWLKSRGWEGGHWGEEPWTVVMIVAAVALGMIVSRLWRDSIYCLVGGWALVAIWERQRYTSSLIEYVSLGGAMLLVLWTLIIAGWIRSHTLVAQIATQKASPPTPV